ncbi:PstS family phosphate ABC transporter substrate-binding protein [Sphingomonas morindae]|uniref:Substrate-binding domain-containing protein n=1 Tax=Sphingomonas morindae TaxID=1541170 RepID=A0ABY4XBM2_9SPHN|nr:substrate-binding domain-containing protein [Sphingomonas morindae]USI74111.1 substrate-binding domain-containing protein [Sphingomonas morindae]
MPAFPPRFRRAALLPLLLALAAGGCRGPAAGPPPRQIRLVGAVAGFPFATALAEQVARSSPEAIAPLARATGNEAGIAAFCAGKDAPALLLTTRPIAPAVRARCRGGRLLALPFGWTAPVLVPGAAAPAPALTADRLRSAITGAAARWSDIDPALPGAAIALIGPAAPEEVLPGLGAPRRDGRYRAQPADMRLVLAALATAPNALALLPYADAARAGRAPLPLAGIAPDPAAIAAGRYPRVPLLLYVHARDVARWPELRAALRLFVAAMEPGGLFAAKGLVPLDAPARRAVEGAVAKL